MEDFMEDFKISLVTVVNDFHNNFLAAHLTIFCETPVETHGLTEMLTGFMRNGNNNYDCW